MLFVSGKSPHLSITHRVYDFFIERYEIASDVEVFHTNLRDENAVGFTEVNGEEQFVQVCNTLDEKEFVTTLLHELVHVVQNENGMIDETEREEEAYRLEEILYSEFLHSSEQQCVPQVLVSQ
tara:strand:- start:764 stop:1132 length:369 start_codon:yes stop_codon:yes gene_type:complete